MTLITCIDTRLGLSFLGKRQSRDKLLSADIVNYAKGRRILIGEYSRPLFSEAGTELSENNIKVSENPMSEACDSDIVFLEGGVTEKTLLCASELVLFCWNRHYPSDKRLARSFIDENFTLTNTHEFVGNSHDNLTRYTLKRKN